MDIGRLTDAELARLRGTDIGVVLQGGAERNLLPYATLADNIWLAQRRAARVRPADVESPERIAALVGLLGDMHRRVSDLPAGARQRAALAAGMAAGPGLLLVDEPTSQLDSAGRDEVLDALERVNSERGTTIVVVTHDAEVGTRMGRLVTIRDGRVGPKAAAGWSSRSWPVTVPSSSHPRCSATSRRAPCSRSSTSTARSRWSPTHRPTVTNAGASACVLGGAATPG